MDCCLGVQVWRSMHDELSVVAVVVADTLVSTSPTSPPAGEMGWASTLLSMHTGWSGLCLSLPHFMALSVCIVTTLSLHMVTALYSHLSVSPYGHGFVTIVTCLSLCMVMALYCHRSVYVCGHGSVCIVASLSLRMVKAVYGDGSFAQVMALFDCIVTATTLSVLLLTPPLIVQSLLHLSVFSSPLTLCIVTASSLCVLTPHPLYSHCFISLCPSPHP